MTVTEVTTSIAIVGGAALAGLLLLPQRLGRPSLRNQLGRFVVSRDVTLSDGLVRSLPAFFGSGRISSRILMLMLVAVTSGIGLGVSLSLLLLIARGATGLSAG